MHLSSLRWSCLWFVLLVVPACSDDPAPPPTTYPTPDGGAGTPDGATPDPDAGAGEGGGGDGEGDPTCDEYARLECNRNRDCFPVFLDWTYGSHDACLTEAKQICQVWSSLAGSSVSSARLVGCLRAHALAGCTSTEPTGDCLTLPGQLANAGACHLNDQCASGYCRREGVSDCGVCADKFPEGATCARSSECRSGRCSNMTCEPILKEGEACTATSDCLRNLVCNAGVCEKVTLVGEGEACGWVVFCDPYLTCANGVCIKDAVVAIGQRCGTLDDGTNALCRNGDCNAESICVNRPAVGAACSPEGSCAGSAICVQGQCRALAPEACDASPKGGASR
jgi:hypothetical protein